MGSIITKNGRLLARVRVKGFKPVAKAFDRGSDARRWAQDTERAMREGNYCPGANSGKGVALLTFSEALKQYRRAVGDRLKGADTYAYWFDELAASALAPKLMRDVSAFDVSAWRDTQAATRAAGTVARKLGLLSGFFTWAHKDKGWIDRNPVHGVRKPRVSDARNRTLNDGELSALQAAARTSKAPWLADALVVLLRSAMRRGELWGLRVADIDFEQSTCHLSDTKNGSARDVPLDPQAREALQRLVHAAQARAESRAAAQGVVLKERDSFALIPVSDPAAISLAFRRTVARARADYLKSCASLGVKVERGHLADLRLHDLRHQAVTTWATAGLSLPELLGISGHKSPRMLVRYVSLKASDLAGKMAAIGASVESASA